MARRFLYIVASFIMLTLAAAIGWNIFQDQIMRAAFVPSGRFRAPDPAGAPDYRQPAAWVSRPGLPRDPARWAPQGFTIAARPEVSVFFVHPTTFLRRDSWNAPIAGDRDTRARTRQFVGAQASAFNGIGEVWAPRYRQAAMGAFLVPGADTDRANELAYGDVARAFEAFVAAIPPDQPILLAGHSQGSLHLLRLMAEKIAGTTLARRIVAAYVVGWPVSVTADVPALGLPACARPGQPGCILSWQSFAEPADAHQIVQVYSAGTGFTGNSRRDTAMLCVNPVTGAPHSSALASANLGALAGEIGRSDAVIERGTIPARCDASGLLLIGAPPRGFGQYVMPGNNYHVFDYALFWANIRADAEARTRGFLALRKGAA